MRKPQTASGFVPWKTACESLKQQQDSCPKHAKRKPEKLSKRCLRNPLKRKKKMPPARKTLAPGTLAPLESLRKQLEIWPWKTASESLKQQQDSCPKHAKRKPEKLSKRCLRNPLKRKKKMTKNLETCKPPRKPQQKAAWGASQETRLLGHRKKHIYYRQERSSGIGTKATRNLALENRMRKPQTAAGFVPKACETQARKTLETLPTEPTKKKEKNASSKENLGARYAPLESLRKQLEIWPWKTASESLKQQQDSCPMQHAKRKPEKLSKRCLRNPLKRKKKMPPARKTLAPGTLLWNRYESNSKSGLGKPHPKASNSSRIRAQSTRNASPKNSRNVAYGTH